MNDSRLKQVLGRLVPRETLEKLCAFSDLLQVANASQNLIAPSTLGNLWERHIIDSAQLVRFEPSDGASWIDVGSGAGLPGIVIAILTKGPVTLVEPRRLRVEFLEHSIATLGLRHVTVLSAKVEKICGHFDVITARAVAPLDRLLGITRNVSHRNTIWVLPKGRNAKSELAEAERNWQYDVRGEASCTDPEARVLVLSNVRAKAKT